MKKNNDPIFYFSKYENRFPYTASNFPFAVKYLFRFLAVLLGSLGIYYIYWRWRYSMNWEAAWFSVPLILAESFAFLSTILIIFNYWGNKDSKHKPPVQLLSEIQPGVKTHEDRPVKIDVFIATYNEDEELVRYSIRDAKAMTYPYADVQVKVYVLDDGRREKMKAVAAEEGVYYLDRKDNIGYKAGNLKNAIEKTDGDLFVILDADTRPFPKFLENTTGYFRNEKLAWVQTPQWFYDLTEPVRITTFFRWVLNVKEPEKPNLIDKTIGSIKIGEDVFGNDPQIFYDVIMRRRNLHNAAFCCGAGSVHRRKAILQKALDNYVQEVKNKFNDYLKKQKEAAPALSFKTNVLQQIKSEAELRPFVYHASEDIYTSLHIHADKNRWQSYQHPSVECKMLSPQDLDGWVKQRTRYASGSLDIAFNDNPLFMKGLSWQQRICYFQTIYSYFAPFWLLVFLLSPAIFFFTLTPPVSTFNFDFFKIFVPFQILNVFVMMLGTWGIPTNRADQYYVSSFWLMLKSFIAVAQGEKVKFHVTRKTGRVAQSLQYIVPHIGIIVITLIGMAYNVWLMWKGTHPSYSGFAANALWSLYNFYNLSIIIMAAFWKSEAE